MSYPNTVKTVQLIHFFKDELQNYFMENFCPISRCDCKATFFMILFFSLVMFSSFYRLYKLEGSDNIGTLALFPSLKA